MSLVPAECSTKVNILRKEEVTVTLVPGENITIESTPIFLASSNDFNVPALYYMVELLTDPVDPGDYVQITPTVMRAGNPDLTKAIWKPAVKIQPPPQWVGKDLSGMVQMTVDDSVGIAGSISTLPTVLGYYKIKIDLQSNSLAIGMQVKITFIIMETRSR